MPRRIGAGLLALGMVLILAAVGASAQISLNLIETYESDLHFSPDQAQFAADNLMPIDPSEIQSFRFADDPNGAPTLSAQDAPWLTPTHIGLNLVEWTPDTVPVIASQGQQPDGDVWVSLGGGPVPGVVYAVYSAELLGGLPAPGEPQFSQNMAFPTSLHGRPGWQHQGDFIADTWQGGAVIPVLTYGPNPWSFHVYVVDGSNLDEVPGLTGFAYSGGSTLVMAFEAEPLFGPPQENIPWAGVGFAGHASDELGGATPSSLSRVTAFPGDLGPRVDPLPLVGPASSHVIRPGFEPRADPMAIWGVVDDAGDLHANIRFAEPWGPEPPADLFSLTFDLSVSVGEEPPSRRTGWFIHDGVADTIVKGVGPPAQMAIISDGSVTVSTGLNISSLPPATESLEIIVNSGFWVDEATTDALFATSVFDLPLTELVEDDPLMHGGTAVYDLIAGLPIAIVDEPAVVVDEEDDEVDSGADSLGTTTDEDSTSTSDDETVDGGEDEPSAVDESDGSNTVPIVIIIGGLVIIIIGGTVIVTSRRGGDGYGSGIRDGLTDSPPEKGDGGEHDTIEDTRREDTSTRRDGTTTREGTRRRRRDETGTGDGHTGTIGDGSPPQTPDGTTFFGDRDEKKKRDCTPLIEECRRLTLEADEASARAEQARARADELRTRCGRARARAAERRAHLAELEPRTNAPQYYQRMAEAQRDVREAESDERSYCRDADREDTEASSMEAAARAADEAARAACQAAADCEKGG
jgi:hypothetical protein